MGGSFSFKVPLLCFLNATRRTHGSRDNTERTQCETHCRHPVRPARWRHEACRSSGLLQFLTAVLIQLFGKPFFPEVALLSSGALCPKQLMSSTSSSRSSSLQTTPSCQETIETGGENCRAFQRQSFEFRRG